jgi:hypothetical protein
VIKGGSIGIGYPWSKNCKEVVVKACEIQTAVNHDMIMTDGLIYTTVCSCLQYSLGPCIGLLDMSHARLQILCLLNKVHEAPLPDSCTCKVMHFQVPCSVAL